MLKNFRFVFIFLLILPAACGAPQPIQTLPLEEEPTPSVGMPNPASAYCREQGGTLVLLLRGDESQYGVCIFEDNRQCEEWAMMRGECPIGGLKVTGYATIAAQYCVITGGEYQITANSGAEDEQGTCAFKNGNSCDVWDYYNGVCNK